MNLNPYDFNGPTFLMFYVIAAVVIFQIAFVAKMLILRKTEGGTPAISTRAQEIADQLTPYEAALLAGGRERAVLTACAALSQHGITEIDRTDRCLKRKEGGWSHDPGAMQPMEEAILAYTRNGVLSMERAKNVLSPQLDDIERKLERSGLIPDCNQLAAARLIPFGITMVSAIAFAVPKLMVGVGRDKPVTLLVFEMLLWMAVSFLFLLVRAETTGLGDTVLQILKTRSSALKLTIQSNPTALSIFDTALAYGVFGALITFGDPFIDAQRALRPQPTYSSSSSGCGGGSSCGGGSCGGGGCGGGCGGCGS